MEFLFYAARPLVAFRRYNTPVFLYRLLCNYLKVVVEPLLEVLQALFVLLLLKGRSLWCALVVHTVDVAQIYIHFYMFEER